MSTGETITEVAIVPFTTSRIFNADRATVWNAWTNQGEMAQWWGPKGAVIKTSTMNFKPGGSYHYGMEIMGMTMWGMFEYEEIAAPERLVFLSSFSDENGGLTRHPLSANWPLKMRCTITFSESANDQTEVTIEWLPENSSEAELKTFSESKGLMKMGWDGSFEQFAAYLSVNISLP